MKRILIFGLLTMVVYVTPSIGFSLENDLAPIDNTINDLDITCDTFDFTVSPYELFATDVVFLSISEGIVVEIYVFKANAIENDSDIWDNIPIDVGKNRQSFHELNKSTAVYSHSSYRNARDGLMYLS